MKKTSRERSRTRFVVPAIVLILVVLSACALWNTSTFDLVWIWATFAVASIIAYLIIAPKLLPISDAAEERRGAYGVFGNFILGQDPAVALIRDGKIEAQSKPSAGKIGLGTSRDVIVTDSTSVVALRTSTGVSRVAGAHIDGDGRSHSGVIFTIPEDGEGIETVIDLRPQIRRQAIKAQTRDGITVEVAVIAFFAPRSTRARKMKDLHRLKHPPSSPASMKHRQPAVPYPPPFAWRRASIIQALNTRRTERTGDETRKTEWYDRIMEIAIPRLRDLISEYTVDELTAWTTTDRFPKHPRYVIRDALVELVKKEMDADDDLHRPTGIDMRFMSVSPPMPPPEVIQRRIQAWSEEWRKKEADIFAQAEAEAILTRELARAQVQGEMTARINDILQEAKEAQTDSGDLVMLRFLESMEKMSNDPTTRALLTLDALKMLKQLRELVAPTPQEGQLMTPSQQERSATPTQQQQSLGPAQSGE